MCFHAQRWAIEATQTHVRLARSHARCTNSCSHCCRLNSAAAGIRGSELVEVSTSSEGSSPLLAFIRITNLSGRVASQSNIHGGRLCTTWWTTLRQVCVWFAFASKDRVRSRHELAICADATSRPKMKSLHALAVCLRWSLVEASCEAWSMAARGFVTPLGA